MMMLIEDEMMPDKDHLLDQAKERIEAINKELKEMGFFDGCTLGMDNLFLYKTSRTLLPPGKIDAAEYMDILDKKKKNISAITNDIVTMCNEVQQAGGGAGGIAKVTISPEDDTLKQKLVDLIQAERELDAHLICFEPVHAPSLLLQKNALIKERRALYEQVRAKEVSRILFMSSSSSSSSSSHLNQQQQQQKTQ